MARTFYSRGGAELIPLINAGADGLKAYADEAQRMGLIIDKDTAQAAENFNDNMKRMGLAMEGLRVKYLGPLMDDLAGFTAFLAGVDKSKTSLADITREIASINEELSGGKHRTDKGLVDLSPSEIQERITKLHDLGLAQAKLMGIVNPQKSKSSGGGLPSLEKDPRADFWAEDMHLLSDQLDKEGHVITAALDAIDDPLAKFHDSLSAAMEPAKSGSAELQDQLNALTGISPVLRNYLQVLVDGVATQEQFAAAIEQTNAMMEATQSYDDAAAAHAKSISDNYDQILRETEDLNASMIKNDEERARKQLEIEHNRTIERIALMEGEQAEIDLLRDAENQRYAAATQAVDENLRRSKSLTKDLGLTFTSAFENAAVSGNKLRDVLAGMAQDLERLLLRKTITEPVGNAISGALDGFDLGGLFKGIFGGGSASSDAGGFFQDGISVDSISQLSGFATGGSFTVGGGAAAGTDSQLVQFMATPGERVSVQTPAQQSGDGGTGVTVVQNFTVGMQGAVRAEIANMMPHIMQSAVAAMVDARKRGGATRLAFRG